MLRRSLQNIQTIKTTHGVGEKKVLLRKHECQSGLTQIAVTHLAKGECVEPHRHSDMEEAFYIMSGELMIRMDETEEILRFGDFVFVAAGESHEIRALTDVEMMTIGCEIR